MDEDYLEAVLDAVAAVPPGRVTTYGLIAEAVADAFVAQGQPPRGGPRQVGRVLSRAGAGVPWWRVVNASGRPPPHEAGRALARLRAEGAPLTPDGSRVLLRSALWWPHDDLGEALGAPTVQSPTTESPTTERPPIGAPIAVAAGTGRVRAMSIAARPGGSPDPVNDPATESLAGRAPGLGGVVAVARDGAHRFSKPTVDEVVLLAGWGIEGDAHAGATVRHRSHARREPDKPNLRQVHLLHAELFDEVARRGFDVAPGDLGENITTTGVPLLDLPTGTVLRLGTHAAIRLTGLRTPCRLIDDLAPGLMRELITQHPDGRRELRAGVMSVVVAAGVVRPGDPIAVTLPTGAHTALAPV